VAGSCGNGSKTLGSVKCGKLSSQATGGWTWPHGVSYCMLMLNDTDLSQLFMDITCFFNQSIGKSRSK
jgi:hypothetical protein